MNISSFTVRWLSLFLGHCSTCADELFRVSLLVCSVLKLLVEGSDGGWVLWLDHSGPDVVATACDKCVCFGLCVKVPDRHRRECYC